MRGMRDDREQRRPWWRERAVGFTLVEILIALTILAIGVLAVSTMQLNATRNTSVGDVLSMGLAVADSRIEMLRTSDPLNDLQVGTAVHTACQQDATYNAIVYTVTCSYATVCESTPCPPGLQSRQFTVSVLSSVQNNPIVLTGKLPL